METIVHMNMTDDTTARLRRPRPNSCKRAPAHFVHIYHILLTNQKKKY